MTLAAWIEFRKNFADVFAFCRECSGALRVLRIVAEQVTILLHVGAASGGVGNDGFHLGVPESVNGLPASSMAAPSSPACTSNAPQQGCAWGATTSQPSAESTRAVAAFTC